MNLTISRPRIAAIRPCLVPLLRGLALVGMTWALVGCAGLFAYRDGQDLIAAGQTEQGLAKLEEAVRLEPKEAKYRIALANTRAVAISKRLAQSDALRREGRLGDAEKAYQQVLDLDAQNAAARQGLDALATARRHREELRSVDAMLSSGRAGDLDAVQAKLRKVLAEDPDQREALAFRARVMEIKSKELRKEAQLGEHFKKPISLEFRETPLRAVLEVVAKVSGLNFYYDKDIRPDIKTTIFAKNTTIEDAMRLMLLTNQLEYKVLNERSLLIYPSTPQKIREYQVLVVRTFFLTNADVKSVASSIKTIVKTKDLVIDERLGIIIMRDTPEAIRVAERIVAVQDIGDPEVMLEVEILEVKRSRLLELGVQWPSQLTLSPLPVNGRPAELTISDLKSLGRDNIQVAFGNVLVNARKEDQDGNILANPRIRVRNKEKAKIQIGDRVPVITTTSTSTGFASESVNYIDVGLKLEVEPTIYLDREVAIKINLEVSNLVREIVSKAGSLSYQIGTRGANTVLRLKDGETQILAGLISDEERSSANKVPLLGELPIAGRLFGSQKDDSQRSEILLSITPRIVRAIQRPDLEQAQFDAGTEANIGAASLQLSSADPLQTVQGSAASDPARALPEGAPRATVPATPVSAAPGPTPLSLSWEAPREIKAGGTFSAAVRVSSESELKGMPLLIAFDPNVLEVVGVDEGTFFGQSNAQATFSQRVDPVQGKVFIALGMKPQASGDTVPKGAGILARVNFKAIKPIASTALQILSASPEPAQANPVPVPIIHNMRVTP